MSKFHKIPIFLIIALVLTFTLASCGKEHEPNPPDPDDINNISEPTEKFIDFVDDCFENYDFVQVYNSEGTEMTVVALLDMSELDVYKRQEEYGVSRLTIRTALHKLSALGLLETQNGEGTYVTRFDFSNLMKNISGVMINNISHDDICAYRDIIESASIDLIENKPILLSLIHI